MEIGVVIPTYNEAENLPRLISALFTLPLALRVLVVDDSSPDGTGLLADALASQYCERMNVLHRRVRAGLASACIQGFRYFLREEVDAIGQMDADLSHDPAALANMAISLETCDAVLGSRYIASGSIDSRWPWGRRLLSTWGNFYARQILRLPLGDLTTGYRLWRAETLRGIPLHRIRSSGYIFQVEMVYLAHRLDYKIVELPIHFTQRQGGVTKMSAQIEIEAAWRVWQMPLAHRDLRCPAPRPTARETS